MKIDKPSRPSTKPSRTRRGNVAVAGLIAGGLFTVVLVAAFWLSGTDEPVEQVTRNDSATPARESDPAPAPENNTNSDQSTDSIPLLTDPLGNSETASTDSATDSEPAVLTQRDQLRAHLDAGEFHLAAALVRSVQDDWERRELAAMIFEAQLEIGEFDAALASLRRLSGESQAVALEEALREQTLAGGGTLADFTTLINLIQQETSGNWFDIDGEGGTISPYPTGVRVDPAGLLERVSKTDQTGRLTELARQARTADLSDDLAEPTPLRFVSLTRLEQAVAERLDAGLPITASMRYLGGLTRVQYVIADPETDDILIGGPAEGWKIDERGIAVGTQSGRPMLHLEDLVTTLRIFSDRGQNIFVCSIVPRQSGLKKLKDMVEASNASGRGLTAAQTPLWSKRMETALGMQDIRFDGVPADSRVARIIIEADYKMKLIGIDRLDAAGIPSFFDLLSPAEQKNPPSLDALRWWLTMNYDAVLQSPEKTVFEWRGPSVKCLSQNELIDDMGNRVQTGRTDTVNENFAREFTARYGKLAKEDIVFADLQAVFDLAMVAALVQKHDLDGRTDWNRGVFAIDGGYRTASHPVPTEVMSVVNHRTYPGGHIVAQVAGGVRADVMEVLNDDTLRETSPRLANLGDSANAAKTEGGWWWNGN